MHDDDYTQLRQDRGRTRERDTDRPVYSSAKHRINRRHARTRPPCLCISTPVETPTTSRPTMSSAPELEHSAATNLVAEYH